MPLSEYGYVFEIDSENCGVTVDYYFTDWYDNENLYYQRALAYNSVSAFALIGNLESITINFSGSSYSVTREAIEEKYPNYSDIFDDRTFVSNVIKLFETN